MKKILRFMERWARFPSEISALRAGLEKQNELLQLLADEKATFKLIKQIGNTLNVIREELLTVLYKPINPNIKSPANFDRMDDSGYFTDYMADSNIREIYITDLFRNIETVWLPVAAIHEETAHPNQADLLFVSAIAQTIAAKKIFEFGTYQGRTTLSLTFASESPEVFTLNLPPEQDPSVADFLGIFFKGTEREQYITQIFADSRTFDPSPYAQSMDFIFIDANHTYDFVKNDTEKAFQMLKPGGVMVWHDLAPKSPGVVRYLHELSKEKPLFRIRNTCLAVYVDGMDVEGYVPPPRRKSWISGK